MQETTKSIGELVTHHPAAARVLERHGIDYCCGGWQSLADACWAKGLDVDGILEEIRREDRAQPGAERRAGELSIPELIEHIVTTYHRPLDAELPRLAGLARKVQGAHGPRDPERFASLTDLVDELAETVSEHMRFEEQTAFPALRSNNQNAQELANTLEDDHREVGTMLRTIRQLTHDYVVPPEACRSYAALWQGLEALEVALHEHIHLENNVLLPRAVGAWS